MTLAELRRFSGCVAVNLGGKGVKLLGLRGDVLLEFFLERGMPPPPDFQPDGTYTVVLTQDADVMRQLFGKL